MNTTAANGYVDIQVNGYGGVDFNSDDVTLEQLIGACQRMREDGVTRCLPTLITDDLDRIVARIGNLVQLREQDPLLSSMIAGLHIEGPFLSGQTGYIGAHPPEHARPATVDAALRILDAGKGLVRILTLAPERDANCEVIRRLVDEGVVVSAGHCNPTLPQLRTAIDAGLSLFTHLGNGCPKLMERHDNIIQRALALTELKLTMIADGHHIPAFALQNYLQLAGLERVAIVSDAISAAGQPAGRYQLAGREVIVDEDGGTWSADRQNLMGSAATMRMADAFLADQLGLDAAARQRLLCDHPATFAKLPS